MNTIVKNNSIKVTCKDGSVILAQVKAITEYGPTPDTWLVNWKSLDGEWKGKAYLKHCVKMTPLECAEASIARQAKFAPLDACMAGYSLGKTKRGPMMNEGYYFSISVYKDNKKIGDIIEEGSGGPVITRFKNHADGILFTEACRNWCQKNLADGRYADECELFWSWWDEGRPKGISALDFNKSEKEQMRKMFGT